jgi:peptide-methionine (R)-S-oxide reductase
MMNTNHNEPNVDRNLVAKTTTRRTFFFTAAGTAGAVALWSVYRKPLLAVEAGTGGGTPGPVTVIEFSPAGKATGKITIARVIKSDADWKKQLSPVSYEVTRHEGTERPYTGSSWNNHDHGLYRCICCENALFSSDTKFESGTGWPSFWQPVAKENVVEIHDMTLGMDRIAVSCRVCDAHLGHVFDDGPRPTGLRYCMNSAAMRFVKLA